MITKTRKIANEPSWIIRNDQVELAVAVSGGRMAPVKFYRRSARPAQPYYIAPWHDEKDTPIPKTEPCLRALRGDWFCMPFGAGSEFRGVRYILHGETSYRKWNFANSCKTGRVTRLTLDMKTAVPSGKVTKRISIVDGQNAVYLEHVLEGFDGRFPLGHHQTLRLPEKTGSLLVSVSPSVLRMTYPVAFGDPAAKSYYAIAVGKEFTDLSRVPTVWQEPRFTDCSAFPLRRGFSDGLACFNRPSRLPAWTAATFADEGFLWYTLKDASVLPMTMFWMDDGGRHFPPWNGRESCLGLEDTCGFFAEGVKDSASDNCIARRSIPTAVRLSPRRPTIVRLIQGVVKVPAGFDHLKAVKFVRGEAIFISRSGKKVQAEVNGDFLFTGLAAGE